jgi:hypothetical protein
VVNSLLRPSARGDSVRLRLLAGVLACALLAGAGPSAVPLPSDDRGAGLRGRVEAQRRAFLANDVDRVLAGFAPRQAIFVRLPPVAPAGFFTPGPLRALVTQLVTSRETVAFEMPVAGDPLDVASGVAHVRARWQYRNAGSDTLQTELMQMTWRDVAGDGAWLIVELKSAAR